MSNATAVSLIRTSICGIPENSATLAMFTEIVKPTGTTDVDRLLDMLRALDAERRDDMTTATTRTAATVRPEPHDVCGVCQKKEHLTYQCFKNPSCAAHKPSLDGGKGKDEKGKKGGKG
ncbi:MAG: hypothetical protein GY903_32250, partial [Fuerstiella sp.]|nr:hypothetical protein [Fuerstiella sp.]